MAPPEYGKACGVDHRRVGNGDYVTESSTCPCYVAGDVSGCTREACTMPCADCPEGSVCICLPNDFGVGAFCLGVTDRASLDARKAWRYALIGATQAATVEGIE